MKLFYRERLIVDRDYIDTAQKMKFSIKNFFSKCDQIHRKLRIWSYLLTKSLMKNFIFCVVSSLCEISEDGSRIQAFFSNKP